MPSTSTTQARERGFHRAFRGQSVVSGRAAEAVCSLVMQKNASHSSQKAEHMGLNVTSCPSGDTEGASAFSLSTDEADPLRSTRASNDLTGRTTIPTPNRSEATVIKDTNASWSSSLARILADTGPFRTANSRLGCRPRTTGTRISTKRHLNLAVRRNYVDTGPACSGLDVAGADTDAGPLEMSRPSCPIATGAGLGLRSTTKWVRTSVRGRRQHSSVVEYGHPELRARNARPARARGQAQNVHTRAGHALRYGRHQAVFRQVDDGRPIATQAQYRSNRGTPSSIALREPVGAVFRARQSATIIATAIGATLRITDLVSGRALTVTAATRSGPQVVNMRIRKALDYDGNAAKAERHRASAANNLSRGLTLAGLRTVSYFLATF